MSTKGDLKALLKQELEREVDEIQDEIDRLKKDKQKVMDKINLLETRI